MFKNKKLTAVLIVYTVVFYAVWAAVTLLLSRSIEETVRAPFSDLIKDGLLKSLVWALPALILIYKNREDMHFREQFVPKSGWKEFAAVFVIFQLNYQR